MKNTFLLLLLSLAPFLFACNKDGKTPNSDTAPVLDTIPTGQHYVIFDSCSLSNSRNPSGTNDITSIGPRLAYTRNEEIRFDSSADKRKCIIRGETFYLQESNDLVYVKGDAKNFKTGFDGYPETRLYFKGDNLFITSTASLRWTSDGYELRALKK